MTKTKKVKAAGRFRVGFGKKARGKLAVLESKQRKKQICPYCKKPKLKRKSKGIWECAKCKKIFASHAYYLEDI